MKIYSVVIKLIILAISSAESLSKDRLCFLHNNAFLPGKNILLSHTDDYSHQIETIKTDDIPQVDNQDEKTKSPLFQFNSTGSEVLVTLHSPLGALWDFIKHVMLRVYVSKVEADRPEMCLPAVVLCCSGGVDSMALLHSFGLVKKNILNFVSSNLWSRELGEKFSDPEEIVFNCIENIFKNFHVFYLDHQVRDDTHEDVKCIRDACEIYGFNLIVKELGSSPPQTEDGNSDQCAYKGFQYMARKSRREYCEELIDTLPDVPFTFREMPEQNAMEEHFEMFKLSKGHIRVQNNAHLYSGYRELFNGKTRGIVFMGHTLNDNVETVLQKLFRGVHISSLSGMKLTTRLGKDTVIARPFIDITKDELKEFMNVIGGTYHEDYTNNGPKYQRNILRQRLMPELCNFINTSKGEASKNILPRTLNNRFKNLTIQSEALQNMINFEAKMFEYYIFKKYGSLYGKDADFSWFNESVLNAYYEMYTNLHKSNANKANTREFRNLQQKIGFLKRIGLRAIEIFRVDEWLLIQNRMVKEEVLRRYILSKCNITELSYRSIHDAVNKIESNPGTPVVKYIAFPSGTIAHQNYAIKHNRMKLNDPSSESRLIFSDEYCKFYARDDINVTVKRNDGLKSHKFHLKFLVPVDSKTNPDGLSFDIRLIRPGDTVPCKSLWVPTAAVLLTKMHFPQILKDEIPVIAMSGKNEIACFYGVNFNPPYCSGTQEVLFTSDEHVKHSEYIMEYIVSVSNEDLV